MNFTEIAEKIELYLLDSKYMVATKNYEYTKIKIGEILGAPKESTFQNKIEKYKTFINNLKKGKVDFNKLKLVLNYLKLNDNLL